MLSTVNATTKILDDTKLDIDPQIQQTPEWCWLTVGEMIFRYYDIQQVNSVSYQCGIVAAFAGPNSSCWYNCGTCPFPAGASSTITRMLQVYPKDVQYLIGLPQPSIDSTHLYSALSKSQIITEIDNDRPIIAGISPSGVPGPAPEHVALIVGYNDDDEDEFKIYVNDPFPFDLPMYKAYNPYDKIDAEDYYDGSFLVNYSSFKSRLLWRESWYYIQKAD